MVTLSPLISLAPFKKVVLPSSNLGPTCFRPSKSAFPRLAAWILAPGSPPTPHSKPAKAVGYRNIFVFITNSINLETQDCDLISLVTSERVCLGLLAGCNHHLPAINFTCLITDQEPISPQSTLVCIFPVWTPPRKWIKLISQNHHGWLEILLVKYQNIYK